MNSSYIEDYMRDRVDPLLDELRAALARTTPQDVISFSLTWLENKRNINIQIHDASSFYRSNLTEKAQQTPYRQSSVIGSGSAYRHHNNNDSHNRMLSFGSAQQQQTTTRREPTLLYEDEGVMLRSEKSSRSIKPIPRRAAKRRNAICTQFDYPEDKADYNDINGVPCPKRVRTKKTESLKSRILIRMTESFLFQHFQPQQLNSLIDSMEEVIILAGEYLFRKGWACKTCYYLQKGEVELLQQTDDNKEEDSRIKRVIIYKPGQTISQMALLHHSLHRQDAIARQDSTVYCVDRAEYKKYTNDKTKLKTEFIKKVLHEAKVFKLDYLEFFWQLSECTTERKVSLHEHVVKAGDPVDRLLILMRGTLQSDSRKYREGELVAQESLRRKNFQTNIWGLEECTVLEVWLENVEHMFGPLARLLRS